jgi:hypothetical protein
MPWYLLRPLGQASAHVPNHPATQPYTPSVAPLACCPPLLPVTLCAGSVKEGAARDPKYDYGEDEELHVLITGDRQEDVSACWGACCIVALPAGCLLGCPGGAEG